MIIKTNSHKENTGPDGFTNKCDQPFEELTRMLLKLSKKKKKVEEILPKSFYETSTISLPKPHKDITKKLQLHLPNEYRCKNLQLNTSKENSTTYKKITYRDM